ncbi:MAG: PVC-type heme-binding CxxCH protein [Verrucomicrobiota bacterium]
MTRPALLRSIPWLAAALPFPLAAQESAGLPRLPALSPDAALAAFTIAPGYRISLAAAEPEVVDPVSLSFAPDGPLYAAEMRDYSERRNEKLSRVRCLHDRDGDGRFETSTVFADGFAWITSVLAVADGVYVAASPDLWFCRDRNGDGKADEREIVFTGFGSHAARLNVQALVNSLTIDPCSGRIFGATAGNGGSVHRVSAGQPTGPPVNLAGADFSFSHDQRDLRAESGTAQFGLTFDQWGNRFVCSNSRHFIWVAYDRSLLPGKAAFAPPSPLVDAATEGPAAEVFRASPEEPWRVVRTRWRASGLVPGIVEGGGRASGYFTSASGIHISTGSTGQGHAFIGDVGSNLVHRKEITWTQHGPIAQRPKTETDREFLTSHDTWFRPVSFATGPDGALYIADMYREFIEHPDSLPPPLKSQMDLNSGHDRGRIWKITRTDHNSNSASHGPAPAGGLLPNRILQSASLPMDTKVPQLAAFWKDHADNPLHRNLILTCLPASEAPAFHAAVTTPETTAALELAAALKLPPDKNRISTARKLRSGQTRDRLAALATLRAADDPSWSTTAPDDPTEVRAWLLRHHLPAAIALLNPSWKTQPALLRSAALDGLAAQPDGRSALLDALVSSHLPSQEIPATLAAQLRRDPATASRAHHLLPPPPADRTAEIARRQPALALTGNPDHGRRHFLDRCATCHRDGHEGFAVGPDRATFHGKGSPTLLVAILDPDREVAGQFATTTVQPTHGPEESGILLRDDPAGVSLRLPGGTERSFPRSEITSIGRPARSLMPTGIEAGLSDQDLADLLAFLLKP